MKNDYTQILIDIQKKSNITVEKVRDIKNLKEEIEMVTGAVLGYNTMRRLFGFLPHTSPSKNTLNQLSHYLGFQSFSSYLNNKVNYDEWFFQQKLIQIQLNKTITDSDLEIFKIGLLNKNNIVAIAHTISFFIQTAAISSLKRIFSTISFQLLSDSEQLKLSTIVTFNLKQLNDKDSLRIYNELIPYENFKNSIPLYYIDYSALNGVYSEILNCISNHSIEESDLLFVELMRFYKSFFTKNDYSNFDIRIPTQFSKFHPVLKGRYVAYLIMKADFINEKLENFIYNECKQNKVNLLIQEIIVALIIKEEYEVLTKLFNKYYESIFDADSWSSKTTNSICLIGLANTHLYSNSLRIAKNNLEWVELDKIELSYYEYVSMLYYLTQLKISFLEKDLEVNTLANQNLMRLISTTGFSVFASKAEKHILNSTLTK